MSSVKVKQALEFSLHLIYEIRIRFKRYDCLLATRKEYGAVKFVANLSD